MTKEEKQILKQLKKEKKYEEIFMKFGQKEFVKSVDKEYEEQDITKLINEGKFEDIYLRYGEREYNSFLNYMKQCEIEEIYGTKSFKAISNKVFCNIKYAFSVLLYTLGIVSSQQATLQIGTTIVQSEMIKSENEKEYKDLITEYQKRS